MISKTGNNIGFSLLEILIAVVVLSLGFTLVYETFFVSLDLFKYYEDYIELGLLIENKLWDLKDAFMHNYSPTDIPDNFDFIVNNKIFKGIVVCTLLDKDSNLYRIDLIVSGKIGRREKKFLRSTYISYKEDEYTFKEKGI